MCSKFWNLSLRFLLTKLVILSMIKTLSDKKRRYKYKSTLKTELVETKSFKMHKLIAGLLLVAVLANGANIEPKAVRCWHYTK